ncbi:beta-propeller fold lactonase family protein [Calycomorphotria hydatis]|uniref:6-phosphogluconolactonase n=1 Tax=Calycomorphotria hydatis TaxID=2528027 RepID=A0A517T5B4_9PLAN|nr:beta-propeller fold lactonase family protein [Calycomorphotria hydatis]QDT63573.1 6-phosphogluconolactonase [Calycomorphotria hydatis]
MTRFYLPTTLSAICWMSLTAQAFAIDAYIVAGQSNGWRLSQLAGSPPENSDGLQEPLIHYFGMNCVSEPDSAPLRTYGKLNSQSKGFGLASQLLKQSSGRDIVFIQYCRCGASVLGQHSTSWWPGDDPQQGKIYSDGLFGQFARYIDSVRTQVRDELGEELELKGLFWHQGESNAGDNKLPYGKAIRNVFWQLRHELGSPDLPIIAGHIRDLGDGYRGINETLDRIAAQDPRLTTVPLGEIAFEPDQNGRPDVHIATAGCHDLGQRMAIACLQLIQRSDSFLIYAPADTLMAVEADIHDSRVKLGAVQQIPLGFSTQTITYSAKFHLLYVCSAREMDGKGQGAVIRLNDDGSYQSHEQITLAHGYSYISLDRTERFLLGVNYKGGQVDVYRLDDTGIPVERAAFLDEGKEEAHCVLTTPRNDFVYIPYVKGNNAIYQYQFDEANGQLTPLTPKNSLPPDGTGPRHIAYHPSKPIIYFSNEQHLGVLVYEIAEDGQLQLKQICNLLEDDANKDGISSSDIVITPDGRFIFAGIRGHLKDFDRISRYAVQPDGSLHLLGTIKADKIPWGMTLSPDGRFLCVSATKDETLSVYRIGADGNLTKQVGLNWNAFVTDLVAVPSSK